MDGKKISFGFAKVNKKQPLQSGPAASVPLKTKDDSIQMIECLEGQSIKVIGKTDEPPPPLVIPLREQDKTTVPDRLAKLLGIRQEKQGRLQAAESKEPSTESNTNGGSVESEPSEVKIKQEPSDGSSATVTETLEQRAAREILDDINQANVKKEEQNNFVVPLLPEELPLDGARESTMDDYESVPIEKFGLAMLRGMGYKDDPKKDTAKVEGPDFGPVMRPKGLGLGADRAMKAKAANALLIPPAHGEILTMKQGAQIKVLAGKHKDAYGTEIKDQALSLKLIELVKMHPVLWSVSSKTYLDANKKVDAWRDIATDLGKPENTVIKKWQSLCAYLRKENAKIKKSMITGSARSEVYESKWFAFESMQFVGNTAKARKMQSTQQHSRSQNHQPPPESIYTDVITHHQPPAENSVTEDIMHHQSPPAENNTDIALLDPENENTETITQNTRKRETQNNKDEDFSAIFSSIGQSLETIISNMNNYSSRNGTFGNYVTQTLEGLPKTKQEMLIHKINQCIYEIHNENDS